MLLLLVALSRSMGQQARMGGNPLGLSFIGLALHGFAKKHHSPRQKTAKNSINYMIVLYYKCIDFDSILM
jgi:hypothetical protein